MRSNIIKPGFYSLQVAADSRRAEFDIKNEVIIANNIPVDFVFIGDSITQRWELNAFFGNKGKMILNRGIGGDTSEYVLKRFEADVLQLKPGVCIMNIGINDSWELEGDPWTCREGKKMHLIESLTISNINSIIEKSNMYGLKLVVCSILPTNMSFTTKNVERNQFIVNVNKTIKSICETKNCIYVDFHSRLVGADGFTIADDLTIEGIHPHVVGYNIMAKVLREILALSSIEI